MVRLEQKPAELLEPSARGERQEPPANSIAAEMALVRARESVRAQG